MLRLLLIELVLDPPCCTSKSSHWAVWNQPEAVELLMGFNRCIVVEDPERV